MRQLSGMMVIVFARAELSNYIGAALESWEGRGLAPPRPARDSLSCMKSSWRCRIGNSHPSPCG